jgi:hypothetical protein
LYLLPGNGRLLVHRIIRDLYARLREVPNYSRSLMDAANGLIETFAEVNYSQRFRNYSNLKCSVPLDTKLEAWRPLAEIGWTGGAALAYPMLLANELVPEVALPKSPATILDEICRAWNPISGFCRDVVGPTLVGDPREGRIVEGGVNGWWSGFMPHLDNRHTAYTNGHAAYYLLKSAESLRKFGKQSPRQWQATALAILDTAMSLQRSDGAFGYLFSTEKREVVDWDGFAGCWFAAAMPIAYQLVGDSKYIESGQRALDYYANFVRNLNCWGTPMDTWRSVDQEGVLAFIQAATRMHVVDPAASTLELATMGAEYEFLWRYGYRTRPLVSPLNKVQWNSCGGSVTSVSNPHIHPMGLVITGCLEYLAEQTGDEYFSQRAQDGLAWALQSLELYPDVMGYGRYGVISERFCPSDGLLIEHYADSGAPASTWWSYNGWAAASVLEGVAGSILRERPGRQDQRGAEWVW